eukprot:COSAG06_NODE_556_length_14336_cov_8.683290_12_plen_173_part_00
MLKRPFLFQEKSSSWTQKRESVSPSPQGPAATGRTPSPAAHRRSTCSLAHSTSICPCSTAEVNHYSYRIATAVMQPRRLFFQRLAGAPVSGQATGSGLLCARSFFGEFSLMFARACLGTIISLLSKRGHFLTTRCHVGPECTHRFLRNEHLFLSFPYVCPKPVLVKIIVFSI